MEALLNLAGLVLGIAISGYTIFSIVDLRLKQRRMRYALIQSLRKDHSWFQTLAASLEGRAEQVLEKCAKGYEEESFATPAAEEDSLPPASEPDVRWLVDRTEHLLARQTPIDLEKLGPMLSKRQIDALLSVLWAYNVYRDVLQTRMIDLKLYPRKKGVLVRYKFVVFGDNLDSVTEKLKAFAASLGLPED